MARHVKNLRRLRLPDAGRFGRKAATLGELSRSGFDVPPGFAIAATASIKDGQLVTVDGTEGTVELATQKG